MTPLHPEDRLDRALELFVESNLLALPIVDGSAEGRVIGIVGALGYFQCVPPTCPRSYRAAEPRD